MKKINLSKTVYELTEEYPELITVLRKKGFTAITSPIARKTAGRVTTIPQGCERSGRKLGEVVEALKEEGFEIEGGEQQNAQTR